MIDIESLLGAEASDLLNHECKGIKRETLALPGPDFIDDVFSHSDRSPVVLRNLQTLFNHGRLAGTGYLSILPVDQGVEHSAGSSFAPNPIYFDPKYICELAIEGNCNAVASTLGGLGIVARRYAHKIPFIMKFNHNELLTYPNIHDQTMFASVDQAFDMGAVAVGATVYFRFGRIAPPDPGSERGLRPCPRAGAGDHSVGVHPQCRLQAGRCRLHVAADLTGQANHLAATIGADIVKQKQPENNGGFRALKFGKTNDKVYTELAPDHPIDLTRYQVANCYMGAPG